MLAGLLYSDWLCGNIDALVDLRVPGVVFCEDGGEYGGGGEGMPVKGGQNLDSEFHGDALLVEKTCRTIHWVRFPT